MKHKVYSSETLSRIATRGTFISLIAAMALLAILGAVGLVLQTSASSSQSLNNIQVFIHPQNSSDNSFLVSVYNSTGGLVASYQSQYAASAFELPSGSYLFAVSASAPYSYGGPIPLAESSGVSSGSGAIMPRPPGYYYPVEYGYMMTTISSSQSFDITTTPVQDLQTTTLTITAQYSNGSAASGASVEASVVGGYYWYYANNDIQMYNTTGSDGVATLIVPFVPVEVNAWSWVPVNLPKNETTTQVNVGGELVNVTVYWQPTYVGLAGSQLVIPPTNSATIKLVAQPPNYWYMPYGSVTAESTVQPGLGMASGAPGGTVASGPAGVPASISQQNSSPFVAQSPQTTQTQISPLPVVATQTITQTLTSTLTGSNYSIAMEAGLAVAIIVASAGVVIAVRRK